MSRLAVIAIGAACTAACLALVPIASLAYVLLREAAPHIAYVAQEIEPICELELN